MFFIMYVLYHVDIFGSIRASKKVFFNILKSNQFGCMK